MALTVIIVLLALGGASLGWTGFGNKKLWDWLQLLSTLAMPVVIALGTLGFTARQNEQQRIIEERRAQAARELEERRAQDDALQAYLDQMGQLVLKKDLRGSDPDSEVRLLVRARTLTVLQRLEDPSRKEEVLRFLQESELVQRVDGKGPVISLLDAKLQGVGFSNATLHGADLYGADLSDADLSLADVTDEQLEEAWTLQGATMPNGQKYEEWLKGKEGGGEDR